MNAMTPRETGDLVEYLRDCLSDAYDAQSGTSTILRQYHTALRFHAAPHEFEVDA